MPDFTEMNNKDVKKPEAVGPVGRAISAFIIVTLLSALGVFLFFTLFGTFTEVGPIVMIYLSPALGVLAALIAALRRK